MNNPSNYREKVILYPKVHQRKIQKESLTSYNMVYTKEHQPTWK